MHNSPNEHDIYTMDAFELEYGRIIENVEVEYFTYGTPKYDEENNITNAVLFFSSFSGKYSFLRNSHEYLRKNGEFGEFEFFFINIRSFGTPNSSSPSTTGLYDKFPQYSIKDQVIFARQFLFEKFKIQKILGLIGEGTGGFHVLTWACEYPDEMEFILVLNSTYKISGYKYIMEKSFENIMDSYDNPDAASHDASKTKILMGILSLIFSNSASKKSWEKYDNDELDAFMEDFIDEGLFLDMYDLKFFNESRVNYNVENQLSDIKAKSLFISTNNDYYQYDRDILPLKEKIKDSTVLFQESIREDEYFNQNDYNELGPDIIGFLKQFTES